VSGAPMGMGPWPSAEGLVFLRGRSWDCFESLAKSFNPIWRMVVCLHRNFALKAVEFANQKHWHAGAREVTLRTLFASQGSRKGHKLPCEKKHRATF